MLDEDLSKEFQDLFEQVFNDQIFIEKPFLAHYTSIETLEAIIKSREIWFANPLFMNDFEEVRFGLSTCSRLVTSDGIAAACGDKGKAKRLVDSYFDYYLKYDEQYLLDMYLFCFSEHDAGDTDGLLSMWRGYGRNGDGVAIVFDTRGFSPIPQSPISINKVSYQTTSEREDWVKDQLQRVCQKINSDNIPEDQVYIGAYWLFQSVLRYALTTKHKGFSEEQEWRAIYWPDLDGSGTLKDCLGYSVGHAGVQPRLRLKLEAIEGVTVPVGDKLAKFDLEHLVYRIIIGPTISSPLLSNSVKRMIQLLDKGGTLSDRVTVSTIPLRKT